MPVSCDSQVVDQLKKHEQDHLLRHWEELSDSERQHLQEQCSSIDFDEFKKLIAQAFDKDSGKSIDPSAISPLTQAIRLPEQGEEQAWVEARKTGHEILDAGKVGAILVAGGQGSRLGFPHPKGMFPVGPVTDRTLFRIFFEQLVALSKKHGVRIPYFIMTSDATHQETIDFLKENDWFGYPEEDVFLFKQGTMPAVDDQEGKILLSEKHSIAMSPDGHGGLLNALHRANLFEEMQRRGIEYLYYHQVDNPCVNICDPAMLGFHKQREAEISTKVVAKRDAGEKVGVLAEVNGTQMIIEYSDLPEDMSRDTDDSGGLKYWAGNIAIHVMNRDLLERLATGETRLPVHIAHKKVGHVLPDGSEKEADSPNAYKFERFIFDSIPLAQNPLVIETSRQEEFNPVKNAEGDDSPATSKAALNARAHRWLRDAGYKVDENASIEISPLVALDHEDLRDKLQPEQLEGDSIVLEP
ncbi:UTP--glucose-1-phosphate uridylyltransferase [Rubinisphaera margarita]|uniref:UTP--glucose-1-phosphate uridylyltransferase n=1 Tax=Rubinisphaera margarita TaxID=2909586 RepID=UPI001EE9375A|nr:UDPGP type 1 family protein [Rubinisphaera margarita]MCG6158051.1 UDPGP type 1 family protein [Rubinisphaera margarita]